MFSGIYSIKILQFEVFLNFYSFKSHLEEYQEEFDLQDPLIDGREQTLEYLDFLHLL